MVDLSENDWTKKKTAQYKDQKMGHRLIETQAEITFSVVIEPKDTSKKVKHRDVDQILQPYVLPKAKMEVAEDKDKDKEKDKEKEKGKEGKEQDKEKDKDREKEKESESWGLDKEKELEKGDEREKEKEGPKAWQSFTRKN